jgi:Leucine Rich repeat
VGPQKLPKEPFLGLLTALAWTAPLLLTGCQEDRRTSKEEIRQQAKAETRPEIAGTIAGFEKFGGTVQIDEQQPGRPVVILDLSFKEVTDAELAELKTFAQLEELYLIQTKITDASLAKVNGFANLRTLDLGRTQVTDKGIAHLEGLSNLKTLGLSSTSITDVAVGHLKALTELELLDLSNTKLTEEGIKDLQRALPKVRIVR